MAHGGRVRAPHSLGILPVDWVSSAGVELCHLGACSLKLLHYRTVSKAELFCPTSLVGIDP